MSRHILSDTIDVGCKSPEKSRPFGSRRYALGTIPAENAVASVHTECLHAKYRHPQGWSWVVRIGFRGGTRSSYHFSWWAVEEQRPLVLPGILSRIVMRKAVDSSNPGQVVGGRILQGSS